MYVYLIIIKTKLLFYSNYGYPAKIHYLNNRYRKQIRNIVLWVKFLSLGSKLSNTQSVHVLLFNSNEFVYISN